MTEADSARFKPGDFVRRTSNPEQAGLVRRVIWDEQLEEWSYTVLFGNALRGIPEADLELRPSHHGAWDEALSSASLAGVDAFRMLMAYERLRRPPTRIAGSFGTAKAALYPYQFIPLLKFLENPEQRILISDDVGLGKTIEAGYILRELSARQAIERVLIVVPSRLQGKWQQEMARRFGEHFDLVREKHFKRLSQQLENRGDVEPLRWITSYATLRRPEVTEVLNEYQPHLDLVIVDEAHRLRNPVTAQHRAGQVLAGCADALIFLTATPVQTDLDNLYQLLHLLSPEEFQDVHVFRRQADANRRVVFVLAALRASPPDSVAALQQLAAMEQDYSRRRLTGSEFFQSIRRRAAEAGGLSRPELVGLQRDVSELSFTSHILTRTRKVDVMKDRPRRRARVVTVEFSAAERSFYDASELLCRRVRPDLYGWGLAMAVLMAHRYTASCIPAAARLFRERLGHEAAPWTRDLLAETEDADGWLAPESKVQDAPTQVPAPDTKEWTDALREIDLASPRDSKLTALCGALQNLWAHDEREGRPPRKVVVFSFFRRTLSYLLDRCLGFGIGATSIHGGIPIEERELRIDNFASRPDIKMLLSSEVGSEGIDLQFASIVVNYDLPWNPMVVEQRIGRLDRIGQRSPVITIINLVAKHTVEERILHRLYDRIGIFQEAIGDIEPILGKGVEKLMIEALRGELTPQEQERQWEETATATIRLEQQARTVQRDADSLLAADQAFLDQVNELVSRRRVPSTSELYSFLSAYLEQRYPGLRLPQELLSAVCEVQLSSQVAVDMRDRVLHEMPEALSFIQILEAGPFLASFDQEAVIKHPRAELLHSQHPLVRLAYLDILKHHAELHRLFALRIPTVEEVPCGTYVFAIYLIEIGGLRARPQLSAFCSNVATGDMLDGDLADKVLVAMLTEAWELDPAPSLQPSVWRRTRARIEEAVRKQRALLDRRERGLNQARWERRLDTLRETLDARVRTQEGRLAKLEDRRARPFAIRMARSRLTKLEGEREMRLAHFGKPTEFHVETEHLALGVVKIGTEPR